MSNRWYDILKWTAMVLLPALATLCGVVLRELGAECTDTVVTLISACSTFLGALLGVSCAAYERKEQP